jgi:hypothetical protein
VSDLDDDLYIIGIKNGAHKRLATSSKGREMSLQKNNKNHPLGTVVGYEDEIPICP